MCGPWVAAIADLDSEGNVLPVIRLYCGLEGFVLVVWLHSAAYRHQINVPCLQVAQHHVEQVLDILRSVAGAPVTRQGNIVLSPQADPGIAEDGRNAFDDPFIVYLEPVLAVLVWWQDLQLDGMALLHVLRY